MGISKRGNEYLRRLFIHGARSVALHVRCDRHSFGEWLTSLKKRAHSNVANVTLANKLARIAWSVLSRQEIIRIHWPHQQAELVRSPLRLLHLSVTLHSTRLKVKPFGRCAGLDPSGATRSDVLPRRQSGFVGGSKRVYYIRQHRSTKVCERQREM